MSKINQFDNSRELEARIDELLKQINSHGESTDEPDAPEAAEERDSKLPSARQADVLAERIASKRAYHRTLAATVAMLTVVMTVAVIISVFLMPVVRVSGSGLEPFYQNGDILVCWSGGSIERGELTCISWQNKLLLKRIIGKAGDVINIDQSGNVYLNGELLDEPYAVNKSLGECDIEFPFTVPEGKLFIIGDRRDTSIDSRSTAVGCVEEETVIGRVLFRVYPFNTQQNEA